MQLAFSEAERAFRREVGDFIRRGLPADIRERSRLGKALSKDDMRRWHRILFERGWAAPHWPKEHGGPGWGPIERYLFEEELAANDAPPLLPFGLTMVGPVIYTFGTAEQKTRFLPPILSGEHFWCQGYSEPGSGSDLASLQTRAVRDGDDYVVTGTKTWTSLAHWSDWMFCLVRTDGSRKPQEGITFLLIDMKSPGVEARRITTIDQGWHVNMTYLQDVRVPVANRIGEENKGWTYAKFLLGNERALIAQIAQSTKLVKRIKEVGARELSNGRGIIDEADFRSKLAAIEVELEALRVTNQRVLYEAKTGTAGNGGAILKSKGTFISQALSELMLEAVGYYSSPWVMEQLETGWNQPPIGPSYAKNAMPLYARQRANTIEGGTEEIQKNVISKQVLGL